VLRPAAKRQDNLLFSIWHGRVDSAGKLPEVRRGNRRIKTVLRMKEHSVLSNSRQTQRVVLNVVRLTQYCQSK
jgi:ribosomal protein L29